MNGQTDSAATNDKNQQQLARQKAAYEKEKGNKCFKDGRYGEAIERYSVGIQCDPLEPTLYCNRAMAYLKLKEYAKAKIDCDNAIELDSTYVKAFYRRAQAYLGTNDKEAARADIKHVIELEPSNRQAQEELKKLEITSQSAVAAQTMSSITLNGSITAKDSILVSPVTNPPDEWKKQSMTRITNIEVCSAIAEPVAISNGTGNHKEADQPAESEESKRENGEPVELPPLPLTSVDFFTRWRSLAGKDKGVFGKYFMNIPIEDYKMLFDRLIDADLLADIVFALTKSLRSSANDQAMIISVSKRLLQISQLERFQVAYAFLEEPQRRGVNEIISKLVDLEKTGQQDEIDLKRLLSSLKEAFDTLH